MSRKDELLNEVQRLTKEYQESLKVKSMGMLLRDDIIHIAIRNGCSPTEVAKAAGISRERLYQIIGQYNDQ